MSRIELRVNGLAYSGWQRGRVTYTIDAIAGSFDFEVSDRWSGSDGDDGEQSWPINVGDAASVWVNEQQLINGWIDERENSLSADSRTFRVSGRDKAGALVDVSVAIGASSFRGLSLEDAVRLLCKPHGIKVSLGPGVDDKAVTLTSKKHASSVTGVGSSGKRKGVKTPKPGRKFTLDPGESGFSAIDKLCTVAGVLPVSDHVGGIVLTRTGSARAITRLVEGDNVLAAHAKYDGKARYAKYIVKAQQPGNDWLDGAAAAAVKGEAQDLTVRRTDRVLVILPGVAMTPEQAQSRAAWEMKTRAARALEVTVVVAGWSQAAPTNGAEGPALPVWPVNALVSVSLPSLGLVDEQGRAVQMLITEVRLSVDDQSGETAELTLKRPDALLPEVLLTPAAGQPWDEIAHGVK